jgi:N-acetylglutamate synthase-like GNAT family acetyltransferase
MQIKLFSENMAPCVSKMIEKSIKMSLFATFYPQSTILQTIENTSAEKIIESAEKTHFYVIEDKNEIVACGGIGPYSENGDESLLYNIFVTPESQGKGYGKKIIETLENDEYFKKAKKTRVRAAISAIPFYRKMGYEFKDGILVYENGRLILEKYSKNI